ncbi:MAG: hypothetical protein ACLFRV_08355 [Acidimicrobiales bacterium]
MKRRTAEHAVDLAVVFPLLERYEEVQETIPPEVRTDVRSFRLAGEQMVGAMLGHAHGEPIAAAALPSLTDLNEWRAVANLAVGGLYLADPDYVETYAAGLPGNHQALIRSMIQWSEAALRRGGH